MSNSNSSIGLFLIFWGVVSLIQAGTTGLINDEAYYWIYTQFPAWGYFDHPPAVAWFISVGDAFMHNELGLRLVTVCSSVLGLYLLWKLIQPYGEDRKSFMLLFLSVPILTALSFMTVPDTPLLLAVLIYWYVYRNWLNEKSMANSLFLGVSMAFLMYSKYHGILIIGFSVLSNLKVLQQKKFWVAAILGLLLFTPHIWWQFSNDFVSFKFHLVQRNKAWIWSMTENFLITQVPMISPLVSLPLIWRKGYWRSTTLWERNIIFQAAGTFAFFFFMSFRGPSEGNWTLAGVLALMILNYRIIQTNPSLRSKKWLMPVLMASVILIQGLRVQFFTPVIPGIMGVLSEVHIQKEDFEEIHEKVGNTPVVFINSYQLPARYTYYTGQKATAHTGYYYRPNQFNIIESVPQNALKYIMAGGWQNEIGGKQDSVMIRAMHMLYLNEISAYSSYLGLMTEIVEIENGVLHFRLEGQWPSNYVQPYFKLIEYHENGRGYTYDLGPALEGQAEYEVALPQLSEGVLEIRICVGEQTLVPEMNGFPFPL